MSRSSTAATCAARAAGWTWPPSRRSSRDRKSRRVLFRSRHKRRLKRGEFFPPFLYVSIINSCNLRCQGCWVDVAAKQEIIQPDAFGRLVREAKAMGNVFFGIVGGEPFMHPHLLDMLAEHPDCYFQIFK